MTDIKPLIYQYFSIDYKSGIFTSGTPLLYSITTLLERCSANHIQRLELTVFFNVFYIIATCFALYNMTEMNWAPDVIYV